MAASTAHSDPDAGMALRLHDACFLPPDRVV
jgi:hypothetical protein